MSVEVRNLKKSFSGREVLRGVSFTLPDEGVVELAGPSGSGKTTLLRLLMGLETPDAGEISGLEQRCIAAVFQEDRLLEHLSAVDNVRFVCHAPDAQIRDHLAQTGLTRQLDERVSKFSGGMKRRVAIVRAVITGADVLMLDEPFKGLDEATRKKVIDYILRHSAGRLILLISHDPAEAEAMGAERRLVLGSAGTLL